MERLGHEAQHRAGAIGRREVVHDVRMVAAQPAGAEIDRIALLGHGQGDDPDAGIGQGPQQSLGCFGAHDHVADRADDAQLLAVRVADR